MTVLLIWWLPLLAGPALGLAAGPLCRRLPPATGTAVLTAGSALIALASSAVVAVVAFTGLARTAPVAALGHWSASALASYGPVSVLAGMVVVLLGGAGVHAAVGRLRLLWAARQFCLRAGGGPGGLVVVDDGRMEAFSVPGDRGRIVVSRPLLSVLTADERRVLLAHEAAHLAHRHHLYRLVTDLAAAVNPSLRPVTAAVRFSTERWADESAARCVQDRRQVASTLARTALLTRSARTVPGAALAAARDGVPARVAALVAPAARPRPLLVTAVVVLLGMVLASGADVLRTTELAFEHAMRVAAGR